MQHCAQQNQIGLHGEQVFTTEAAAHIGNMVMHLAEGIVQRPADAALVHGLILGSAVNLDHAALVYAGIAALGFDVAMFTQGNIVVLLHRHRSLRPAFGHVTALHGPLHARLAVLRQCLFGGVHAVQLSVVHMYFAYGLHGDLLRVGSHQSNGILHEFALLALAHKHGPVKDSEYACQIGAGDVFSGNDTIYARNRLCLADIDFIDATMGSGSPAHLGIQHVRVIVICAVFGPACYLVHRIQAESFHLTHAVSSSSPHTVRPPQSADSPYSGRDFRRCPL